jgi:dTDP-4-dehydrorhamnose reductase
VRILVVGAAGQLGQAMAHTLASAHTVVALTRQELDITQLSDVEQAVRHARPDGVVNCASYNDVNGAELHPVSALETNAWGTKHLARTSAAAGIPFIHFSTDFVFDGETDTPYVETDAPNPRGYYAMSKLVGEWLALEGANSYVLRVESLFGGPRAKSSVDLLMNAIVSGAEARPFSDRVVSPSYVEDVVAATARLLDIRPAPGLYHCVNTGLTTWLDLTKALAALVGRPGAPIAPQLMADANLKPPRPRYAALSNAKLTAAGIEMPRWENALARHVAMQNSGFRIQN